MQWGDDAPEVAGVGLVFGEGDGDAADEGLGVRERRVADGVGAAFLPPKLHATARYPIRMDATKTRSVDRGILGGTSPNPNGTVRAEREGPSSKIPLGRVA